MSDLSRVSSVYVLTPSAPAWRKNRCVKFARRLVCVMFFGFLRYLNTKRREGTAWLAQQREHWRRNRSLCNLGLQQYTVSPLSSLFPKHKSAGFRFRFLGITKEKQKMLADIPGSAQVNR